MSREISIPRFVAPAVVAFVTSACYPTLPPQFAEGTDVLAPRKVGLTFVGVAAGGVTNLPQSTLRTTGGGLETRVRVGIGGKQEIGASLDLGIGTGSGGGDPPFLVGGKVSYKFAPLSWLAFVADAGVLDANAASIALFGGDLAAIVALYTAPDASQLYTGARGAFAIPVLQNAHAVSESVTVPIGYAMHTSDRVRLFIEAGVIAGFTQQVIDTAPSVTNNIHSTGGYGLVGFGYLFR